MGSELVNPANVLYIDSDPADALMIQESFAHVDRGIRLHFARNGKQALRFVRRAGEFGEAPRPHLILLELDLPGLSGLRVLAQLKGDANLMAIPVVVFSACRDPLYIQACYALHANAYIVKPDDLDGFTAITRQLTTSFAWLIEPSFRGRRVR